MGTLVAGASRTGQIFFSSLILHPIFLFSDSARPAMPILSVAWFGRGRLIKRLLLSFQLTIRPTLPRLRAIENTDVRHSHFHCDGTYRDFRRFTDHCEQPQTATGGIDSSLQVVLHLDPSSHSGMPLTRIVIFSLPSAHELGGAWITLLYWRLSASNIEKRVVQTASCLSILT